MYASILAVLAKIGGPFIVTCAPWLLPFVGWIKPAFRGALIVLLLGGTAYATWWLTSPSKNSGAELQAQCQAAINKASAVALQLEAQSNAKAQAAAANARAAAYADLDDAANRIAELERALAKLSDDPVAFPKSLAKELRR